MWYKAASVITAILQCENLSLDEGALKPSCPKNGNNVNCFEFFPKCDGETKECKQRLRVVNKNRDPINLYFDYYLSQDERDGRIKKQNSTLQWLLKRYKIDETRMISA